MKRDTKTDVPRRIYHSTLSRIDKHLEANPKPTKTGVKRFVKADFNKFLLQLLDFYELFQVAELSYATKVHTDLAEARGEAIMTSAKSGKPVEWPQIVIRLGVDGE